MTDLLLDGVPADVEAERNLLACVLVDGDQIPVLATMVAPADFYRESTRAAWMAALAVAETGEIVNQITVAHLLSSRGQLDLVGGQSELGYIVNTCPASDPGSAQWYAKTVRCTGLARQVMQRAHQLAQMAQGDPEQVEETIERGISMLSELLVGQREGSAQTAREVMEGGLFDLLENRMADPLALQGKSTGFSDLDFFWDGLVKKRTYVLAAESSAGKSQFAEDLALRQAEQGEGVLFFSTEMSNIATGARMVYMLAKVDPFQARLAGEYTPEQMRRVREAQEAFRKLPIIFDDRGDLSFAHIRNAVRRHKAQGSIDHVFVDHLDMMGGGERNRTQEMDNITRGLKQVAMTEDVAMVEVSQLSRVTDNNRGNKNARLRNSGGKEQDADVITYLDPVKYVQIEGNWEWVLMSQDEAKAALSRDQFMTVELSIHKNRGGKTGKVRLLQDWRVGGRFVPIGGE